MMSVPRILLVDDDPAVCKSLQFSLELEGFDVATFESGEALANEQRIPEHGCLVLDYRLPGMTGLALLGLLRSRGVRLPAVIITSNPNRSLRKAAADAGATLIEKPLLTDALTASIRSLIGAHVPTP